MNTIISKELLTLCEIYENLTFEKGSGDSNIYGSFLADIKLSNIEGVVIRDKERTLKIDYLPELILNFWLIDLNNFGYEIDCVWLSFSLKTKLINKLKTLENNNEDLLWRLFKFLEDDCLIFLFGVTTEAFVEISTTYMSKEDLIMNDKLFDFFHKYNHDKSKSVFNISIFECKSCLQQRRGKVCLRLRNCSDIFCHECAAEYFNTQIKNGELELRCLICSGNVDYDEIKGVLSKETFERWDQLTLSQYLRSSGTALPCPRCDAISPVEDDCGLCPKCQYAFCTKCKEAYDSGFDCQQDHACPICNINCKVTNAKGICLKCKYEFCSRCDNRCHPGVSCNQGKRVKKLTLEESERLLRIETHACPKCHQGYEKVGGCNKMICLSCRVYFCHLCKKILNRFTPYAHFGVLPQCPLA